MWPAGPASLLWSLRGAGSGSPASTLGKTRFVPRASGRRPRRFPPSSTKATPKHCPMRTPVLWGDESTARARLGSAVADLQMTRVMYQFDYPFSPAGVVDFFRDYYGPTNRVFAALTAQNQKALHEGLVALWSAQNHSSHANRTVVDSEYLQIVATRAPMVLARQK